MRYLALWSVLCAALCAAPGPWLSSAAAQEAKPLLTLVYTANTLGAYRECSVCGQNAQGGLGRRATVFKNLRAGARDSLLFVAGAYEFTPIVQRKPEPPAVARVLVQAFAMLGYDLGAVARQEARWLAAADAPLPAGWQVLEDRPRTTVIERGGLRLAFVLFPELGAGAVVPDDPRFALVRTAALEARSGADLVVGVSAWGEAAELVLIQAMPGAFDIVLGAGKSPGYGVRPMAGGRTLWVRPPFDGRGVVRLDLMALPAGPGKEWREGMEYRAAVDMLGWTIPHDPEVANLFSWL